MGHEIKGAPPGRVCRRLTVPINDIIITNYQEKTFLKVLEPSTGKLYVASAHFLQVKILSCWDTEPQAPVGIGSALSVQEDKATSQWLPQAI